MQLHAQAVACTPSGTSAHAAFSHTGRTWLNVTPLGAAAVAAPVRALLAPAVSSTGAPRAGMTRGRLLELGTGLLLTRPVAVTM